MRRGLVQEEWERDSNGLPAMTGPVFFDAVFEMVDQWSPSVKVLFALWLSPCGRQEDR